LVVAAFLPFKLKAGLEKDAFKHFPGHRRYAWQCSASGKLESGKLKQKTVKRTLEVLRKTGLLKDCVCRVSRFDRTIHYESDAGNGAEPDFMIALTPAFEKAASGS